MISYVNGFMFDKTRRHVVLIEKQRPAWQKGRLNGVGGKREEGETYRQAMQREFREETGVDHEDWNLFGFLRGEGFEIAFFRAFSNNAVDAVETLTDERVLVLPTLYVTRQENIIPNLYWLIPMALSMDKDQALLFDIKEYITEGGLMPHDYEGVRA
jgi:8-oxo-dGTP diphosphatase